MYYLKIRRHAARGGVRRSRHAEDFGVGGRMPPHNERAPRDVSRNTAHELRRAKLYFPRKQHSPIKTIPRLTISRSFTGQKSQIFPNFAGFRVWLEAVGHGEERPLA